MNSNLPAVNQLDAGGWDGWMGRGIKIPMGDEGNVDEHMVLE